MKRILILICLFLLIVPGVQSVAHGWHDQTHLAVSQAAGYDKWYLSVGADMAKLKAGTIEKFNHYFNNIANRKVTPGQVLDQMRNYNDPHDEDGHLYGAIMASMHDYIKAIDKGKYAEYHLAFCAHYIADLSQPFHNMPYDTFNRDRHLINDGIVDKEVRRTLSKIEKQMYKITIRSDRLDEDMAREIARIANIARALGAELKKDERDMTSEEAFRQLGHSASLLKAMKNAIAR
jgi:hypothetical protein